MPNCLQHGFTNLQPSMSSTDTLSGDSLTMCIEHFKRSHNIEPEIPIVRTDDKGHLTIRNEYKDFFFFYKVAYCIIIYKAENPENIL